MPMRVTRDWLGRAALGLMSGALALSVLSTGASSTPGMGARAALADEIDCYNDKDLYDLPECVERRAIDIANGEQPNEAQAAPQNADGTPQIGAQPTSTPQSGSQGSTEPPAQGASNPPAQGASNPPANQQTTSTPPPSQQAAAPADDDEDEDAPAPRGPLTDPRQAVLTAADAGKEATEYKNEDGSDKWGKFSNTRFERDRSTGASSLGPNVMESKVWVTKDAETAKQLFKEQAAVKNFPERKEGVKGPVEKIKPASYGEEFAFIGGFWQDEKVWQHWRFVVRQGNAVAVVYLFGREEYFQDQKDKNWTGHADWFNKTVAERL
jgi:hypothetical protein